MNPARLRDLNREGEAILDLIEAIPRGREYDMAGHLDAKKAARTALRSFLARMRNELPCGDVAKPLVAGQSGRVLFPVQSRRPFRP